MSEEDIDLLVGRLMREKSDALRRQAAIREEMSMIEKKVAGAFNGLAIGTPKETVLGQLEPIRKYFSIDALAALLEERETVQKRIVDALRRLRELGIES